MLRPLLDDANTRAKTRAPRRAPRRSRRSAPSCRPRCARSRSRRCWTSAELGGRPALVVAADDRAARDLALDLRAYLRARARCASIPARGVRYESQLAPPPAPRRPADRGARPLLEGDDERSAGRGRQRRRADGADPRPRAAPARLRASSRRRARPRRDARAARRRRLRARRAGRRPRAVRGARRHPRHLPRDRGARRRASSCSATRSSRCAGSRPSRSVRWARRERVEIAPAAELGPEYRELAEMAADRRSPSSGPTSPRCCRSTASARFLELIPERGDRRARGRGGAAAGAHRPLAGRHDQPPLRRRRPPLPAAGRGRRGARAARERAPLGGVRRSAAPAPRAGRRHRGDDDPAKRSRSWRSWCAPATWRWSRWSTGAARPSAPPTTSHACGHSSLDEHKRLGEGRVVRAGTRCARGSSRRS